TADAANAGSAEASAQAPGATAGGASAETPSADSPPPSAHSAADAAASSFAAGPADWTQWRGAARDGRVAGFRAPAAWPKTLREEWKVNVGTGHATPLVADGRVYVFARAGDEEVLRALDARNGRELWKSSHAVAYEMNPAARGHGKGPKSTPALSGDTICTLGIAGTLSCHDARNGRVKWRKEFGSQYGTTSPIYGTSMSPVFDGGRLVAHVGGHDRGALTAFDAETGKVRWSFEPDGPSYASPVIATLAGARQIITFTQKELVAVKPDTGELLWKLPAKTGYDTNCNTPVVYKDLVIFSREGRGVEAVRVVREGKALVAREAWRNEENELYMSSPVVERGVLFGFSSRKKGQFFAVDADTGKTLWQGEGRAGENAAILTTGDLILALTDDATLHVLSADAKSFATVARVNVATSPTWAHPVPVADRLLVKDETTLASLSLR
ncbi:MAG TPA: PQQ-binding-like beta-propeller repeat protein, partial [Pyrinomonadaceae bacterium]|nr:PQQ-binding-like beta-propeller repeat protein [Pyrinomonadaceae bacterium]